MLATSVSSHKYFKSFMVIGVTCPVFRFTQLSSADGVWVRTSHTGHQFGY